MEGAGGDGQVVGFGGGGHEGGDGGVQRKAGFSTFHIRRGDFQYTRVRALLGVAGWVGCVQDLRPIACFGGCIKTISTQAQQQELRVGRCCRQASKGVSKSLAR